MSTYTQQPSDDTHVRSSGANTNYGDITGFRCGGWGDTYITGIRFDVDSLPSDIESAKINIYLFLDAVGSLLTKLKWQKINESWSEDTVTWNNRPSGMENNSGETVSLPGSVGGWVQIDITDLYKDWKDGTQNNYGVSISGNQSSYSNDWADFRSKEFDDDESLRPYLEVESSAITFTITDTLSMTENSTNTRSRISDITDNIETTENVSIIKTMLLNITDSLHLTETVSGIRSRIASITDGLGLTDSVGARKKWRNTGKNPTSFTNNTKSSTSWTNEDKSP